MKEKLNYNRLIIISVITTIVIILGLLFVERYFHSKIAETRIEQYQEQQELIAVQTASSLKDFMEHVKLELISIALTSRADEDYFLDKSQFSNYHKSMIESITSVIRINKEGEIIKYTGEEFLTYSYGDITLLDLFSIPKNTDETYISEFDNEINNKRYIIVSQPVYDTRQYVQDSSPVFDGILIAFIDVDSIQELYLDQIKIGLNGYIWAVKTDGSLLTEPKNFQTFIQKGEDYFNWVKTYYPKNSNNINKMIAESTGSVIDVWENNDKTLTSYSHVNFGGTGWIIAVTTPYADLISGIESLQQKMLSFFIFSVALISVIFILMLIILKSKEKTVKKLEKAEITLKKLGIRAIPEYSAKGGIDIDLENNNIYLIKKKVYNKSFELFVSFLNKDYLGLVISRKDPKEIKEEYGLEKTPIIRLRESSGKEDKFSIMNTKDLISLIEEFIGKNNKSIIFIDRLDYIVVHNGFDNTIKFIHKLKDILNDNSVIIISLDSATLEDSKLALIEQECQDISNIISTEKPKLPKDLYDILEFVYKNNLENRIIMLKNISREFNFTKPTRKKKLDVLLDHKFIKIEGQGRIKSISVTPEGIKFLESD